MKISSTTTSDKTSKVVVSDNYLKIDIKLGNRLIAFVTVDREVVSFTFVGGGSYHERISKKKKGELCEICRTGHNGQKCQTKSCSCELCHRK